jgi:hypothetical protein
MRHQAQEMYVFGGMSIARQEMSAQDSDDDQSADSPTTTDPSNSNPGDRSTLRYIQSSDVWRFVIKDQVWMLDHRGHAAADDDDDDDEAKDQDHQAQDHQAQGHGAQSVRLKSIAPSNRSEATAITYQDKMYIFGGIQYMTETKDVHDDDDKSRTRPLALDFNDLWAFDYTSKAWTELTQANQTSASPSSSSSSSSSSTQTSYEKAVPLTLSMPGRRFSHSATLVTRMRMMRMRMILYIYIYR